MGTLAPLLLLMLSAPAIADGRQFLNGRFPSGKTTVLQLTERQKDMIDLYARCRDQNKTPFVFKLTAKQSEAVRRQSGLSLSRFQIYDSLNGDENAEDGYNYIIRFDQNYFEVPHEVLIPEAELRHWETKVMGWAPSPLANVNPKHFKRQACPT